MLNLASLIVAGGLLAGQASAHLGHGVPGHLTPQIQADIAKRGMARRQATYNDQTWQAIKDPKQECTDYDYGPADSFSAHFPTVWETATIVPSDTEAQKVFQDMKSKNVIPNIAPKGKPDGSAQGTKYDNNKDPDCWWTATTCTQPKISSIPKDITECPTPETWGYTFDDGPNCTHNAFYDFLKTKNQKATLFYIGSNVMDWPLQAQRGLTDGHQLAAHTWSHRYTTALTDEQVFAEFYYTIKAIKWVTGVTVTSWRPPYGDVDDRVRAIAHELGLDTILWSHDTNDWAVQPGGPSPTASIEANYKSIIGIAKQPAGQTAGPIVLSHEINGQTQHLAMSEYPNIVEAYKHIVPVDVCRNRTQPYREGNYVYPNFEQYIAGNTMPTGIPEADKIVAASVSSIQVGAQPSSSSAAILSPSSTSGLPSSAVNPSAAAQASSSSASANSASSASSSDNAKNGNKKSGATGNNAAAIGSAALAAVGGAAALFV